MDGFREDLDLILAGKTPQKREIEPSISSNLQSILDRMRGGTSSQESDGKTYAVNPDSGALGEFQVMPENVPDWTFRHYKKRLTPEQFKNNPEAQRIVFDGEMGGYLQKALKRAKGDQDKAIRMAAAAWYGGEGAMNLYDDPKPQYYKGDKSKKYPSFREYTTKVLQRTKGNFPSQAGFADFLKGLDAIVPNQPNNKINDFTDGLNEITPQMVQNEQVTAEGIGNVPQSVVDGVAESLKAPTDKRQKLELERAAILNRLQVFTDPRLIRKNQNRLKVVNQMLVEIDKKQPTSQPIMPTVQPTFPVQNPVELPSKEVQTLSQTPVLERQVTLDAQEKAMQDKNSSSVAVLYPSAAQIPDFDENNYFAVETQEGTLLVNEKKIKKYFSANRLGTYQRNKAVRIIGEGKKIKPTDLIGGKAFETTDTSVQSNPLSLVTTDENNNELNASVIKNENQAEQQTKLDQQRFANQNVKSEIVPTAEIVQSREENRPIKTTDADYEEYANFQRSQNQPVADREEFDRLTQNFGKGVEIAASVNAPDVRQPSPEIPPDAVIQTTPTKLKNVTNVKDALKTSVGQFKVDLTKKPKGINLREYLFRASFAPVAAKYGIDTDEAMRKMIELYGAIFVNNDDKLAAMGDKETAEQIKQKGKFYTISYDLGTINDLLGGSPDNIAPQIKKEFDELQQQAEFEAGSRRDPLEYKDESQKEFEQQINTDEYRRELERQRNDPDYIFRREAERQTRLSPFNDSTEAGIEELTQHIKSAALSDAEVQEVEQFGRELGQSRLGQLYAGAVGAGANFADFWNGLIGRPLRALGINEASRVYTQMSEAMRRQSKAAASTADGTGGALQFIGALPLDLTRLIVLSRLPGGTVVGFATDAGLQSYGRGDTLPQIAGETIKGAALGKLFGVGESVKQKLGEKGFSKLIAEGSKIGTIASGTFAIEKVSGASNEDALKSALLNSLFDLVPTLGKAGFDKIYRIWKNGKSHDVYVDEKGLIRTIAKVDDRFVDVEVMPPDAPLRLTNFKDVTPDKDGVYRAEGDWTPIKEKEKAENKGNVFRETQEPRALAEQNPLRAEYPNPRAVKLLETDAKAQRIAEILADGKNKTVEEIAKITRYKPENISEAVMNLFDARKVEILPDNSVRLISDTPIKPKTNNLYEQAQARKQPIQLQESPLKDEVLTEVSNETKFSSESKFNPETKEISQKPEISEAEKLTERTKNVYENLPQQKEVVKEPEKPKAQIDFKERPDLAKSLTVFTERGRKAHFEPRVVEESDLLTSLDEGYPMQFQPRDRTRLASKAQISEIANKLNPEFLGDSPKASDGRPLVVPVKMPDGKTKYAVISGNGRTQGIREAYNLENEGSKAYKNFALTKGGGNLKRPVYVGILDPEQIPDFSEFAKESNESSTAQMSASEQAKADADRLDASVLNLFVPAEDGTIHGAANRDFVRAFLDRTTSTSERNRFVDSEGKLNQEGVTRVKNAIFAKAFGSSDMGMATLQRMAESTDSNIKNITNALLAKAGELSSFAEATKDSRRFKELDIAPDFARAVEKYSELKESGTSLDEYIQQGNLFGADTSPLQTRVMQVFDFYKRRTRAIRTIIDNYIQAAEAVGDPNQQGLFGDTEIPSKESIFEGAVKAYEEEHGQEEQNDLFDADQRRENEPGTRLESDRVSAEEKDVTIDEAAHEAALSPKNDLPEPTQAMKEAGNYRKGHIAINGLDISIENPVGSIRKGKDWQVTMKSHYGYIKRTIGADEEHIDVFVKEGTPEDFDGEVYVIDQFDLDDKFDEHKVMIGFSSEAEAREAYLANYTKDWKGLKSITPMPFDDFKDWIASEQKHPAAETKDARETKNDRKPLPRLVKPSEMQKMAETGRVERETNVPLKIGDLTRGKKVIFSENFDYLSANKVYEIESVSPKQIYFRNPETRGGTYLRNRQIADAIQKGILRLVEDKPKTETAASFDFTKQLKIVKHSKIGVGTVVEGDGKNRIDAPGKVVDIKNKDGETLLKIRKFSNWSDTNFTWQPNAGFVPAKQSNATLDELKTYAKKYDNLQDFLESLSGDTTFRDRLTELTGSGGTVKFWEETNERKAPEKKQVDRWATLNEKQSEQDADQIQFTRPTRLQEKPTDIFEKFGRRAIISPLGFFSAVEQTILDKIPNRANAKMIRGILRAPGIKQEEVNWLGIDDFLDSKETFTKEELLNFIRANNADVREVVKGQKTVENQVIYDDDSESWAIADRDGNIIEDGFQSEYAAEKAMFSDAGFQQSLTGGSEINKGDDTKYSDYQLEGEKSNYRELLLTMPPNEATKYTDADVRRELDLSEGFWDDLSDSEKITARINFEQQTGIKPSDYSESNQFKSPHFDEPNILAHVRFNERYDSGGKRLLFIEEIQSDWHQAGRKKGYKNSQERSRIAELENENNRLLKIISDKNPIAVDRTRSKAERKRALNAVDDALAERQKVLKQLAELNSDKFEFRPPDAPFKKSWHELAFKRMLRYAAENNFDKLVWTSGDIQFQRYGSERVDWKKREDGTFFVAATEQRGGQVGAINIEDQARTRGGLLENEGLIIKTAKGLGDLLNDIFRRSNTRAENEQLAKKLWDRMQSEAEGTFEPRRSGMQGFYDQILPSFANKFVKKWGGKVETVDFSYQDGGYAETRIVPLDEMFQVQGRNKNEDWNQISTFETEKQAKNHKANYDKNRVKISPVHSVEITPEMKESVLSGGMPLFARARMNDGRDMILFGTKDVKELRRAKNDLIEADYPKAEVEKFVDKYFEPKNYATLEGKDNVYFVMPSTSGQNTIPRELAKRLQQTFGGKIVQNFARALNKTESKRKGGLKKISNPAQYELTKDVTAFTGKNLVIVDDVLNTGDTVEGLRRELNKQGFGEAQIAVLGTAGIYTTTPRTIERIAEKLAKLNKLPYDQVLEDIRPALENTLGQYSHYVESSIKGWSFKQVYRTLKSAGEKILANAERTQGIQPEPFDSEPETGTEIQRAGIQNAARLAERKDSERRNLTDSAAYRQQEDLLINRLERLKNRSVTSLSHLAKVESDHNTNLVKLNPAAGMLYRYAIKEVEGDDPGIFFGSYQLPHLLHSVLREFNVFQEKLYNKGEKFAARKMGEIINAFEKNLHPYHQDLAVVITTEETPLIEKFAAQEELLHRADFRTRDFKKISLESYQKLKGYQKARENVKKIYGDINNFAIHNEIIAKANRDDADKELGISWNEIDEILDVYFEQLEENNITPDKYRENYQNISERAEQSIEKYEQRFSERSKTDNEKNESARSGKDSFGTGSTSEIRKDSGTNSTKLAESRQNRLNQLRQTEILSADRGGTENTTGIAERKNTGISLHATDSLEGRRREDNGHRDLDETSLDTANLKEVVEMSKFLNGFSTQYTRPSKAEISYWKKFVTNFVKNERQSTYKEIIVNFRRAGLLTGVKTHLRNMASNALMQTSEEAMRPIALLADLTASAITGKRTVAAPSVAGIGKSFLALVRADETFKTLNLESGIARAWNILLNGDIKELKKNQLSEMSSGLPLIDKFVNTTFRLLGAEDALFKVYATRRSLEEQAKSIAATRARKISWKYPLEKLKYIRAQKQELLKNPTKEMLLEAMLYADFTTFTNDNPISDWFKKVKDISDSGKFVLEILVPYDKTPTNIVLRSLEHTPFGLVWVGKHLYDLKKGESYTFDNLREKFEREYEDLDENRIAARIRVDKKFREAIQKLTEAIDETKTPDERDVLHGERQRVKDTLKLLHSKRKIKDAFREADRKEISDSLDNLFPRIQQQMFARSFGRAGFGTMLFALGIYLAMRGLLSGSLDLGKKDERDKFFDQREKGVLTGSVQIGKRRYQINDTPAGKVMILGATVWEKSQKKNSNPFSDVRDAGGNLILEQPLLHSLDDYFGSNKSAEKRIGGLLGSFVPTILADVADVTDGEARRNEKFYDAAMNRTPGLRNLNEKAQNDREPYLQDSGNRILNKFDPFNSRPVSTPDYELEQKIRRFEKDKLSGRMPAKTLQRTAKYNLKQAEKNFADGKISEESLKKARQAFGQ